jgi:hypothetical protein
MATVVSIVDQISRISREDRLGQSDGLGALLNNILCMYTLQTLSGRAEIIFTETRITHRHGGRQKNGNFKIDDIKKAGATWHSGRRSEVVGSNPASALGL